MATVDVRGGVPGQRREEASRESGGPVGAGRGLAWLLVVTGAAGVLAAG